MRRAKKPCEQTACTHYEDCPFLHDTGKCLHAWDVNADPFLESGAAVTDTPRKRK